MLYCIEREKDIRVEKAVRFRGERSRRGIATKEMDRYSRQRLVREIGEEGQNRIRRASVLVVGLGGLGSPAALYLAAAGIGTLGLADGDRVETSNLQRQVIHRTGDEGVPKTESAKRTVASLNPDVRIRTYPHFLERGTVDAVLARYDIAVSATDTLHSKLMLSDACVRTKTPCVHAGVSGVEGQIMTYVPGSACYRCAFDFDGRSSAGIPGEATPGGTLGVTAGVAGTLQAAEALKFLCGFGSLLRNRLLLFDVSEMDFRTMKLQRRSGCSCGASGVS